MVLDNEALGQIVAGRPSRPLLVALEAAVATTGQLLLPTNVVVERRYHPATPVAANANRLLRAALHDELTCARAAEAVRLLVGSNGGPSVVDAHVAAAALAIVRRNGGTATIMTSDAGDMLRLIDAADDADARAAASVQLL
ncbi:MAG: hypothetical protein ACRDZO_20120 [Egibacteraceae bacterium]